MAKHTGFPPLDARPFLGALLLIAMLTVAARPAPIAAEDDPSAGAKAKQPDAKMADKKPGDAWASDPYPYDVCVVSGEPLGEMGDPIVKVYDGREVRFCCDHCIEPYEGDRAKYDGALDAKLIADQREAYPLTTCPISGEPLGGMGEPDDVIVGNRLVRLCCSHCRETLAADPAKYMAKLDAAMTEAQMPDYPTDTCVVSGEPLEGSSTMKPYNAFVNGRLVRLCCKGCARELKKNPAKVLAMVEEARAAASE